MRKLSYVGFILAIPAAVAAAGPLVYTPVNPSFGGSPLNGPNLLNSANSQNKLTDPAAASLFRQASQSQLDLFNQRLQSLILDRVATSLTGSLFDANGNLKPGTVDTSTFSITIVDQGGGMLLITTIDKTTGASTSFTISTTP
jgi:curli production assembly/transport component CsgF